MQISVRHQSQETCTLHCGAQLALVACLRAGDARRDQFAVFGDEFLEDVDILVINFEDLLNREALMFDSAGDGCTFCQSICE